MTKLLSTFIFLIGSVLIVTAQEPMLDRAAFFLFLSSKTAGCQPTSRFCQCQIATHENNFEKGDKGPDLSAVARQSRDNNPQQFHAQQFLSFFRLQYR